MSSELWKVLKAESKSPFFLFAGPCVIESEAHTLHMATALKDICESLGIPLVFKSSFDKANRTSLTSYRGPGLKEGLRILEKVKNEVNVPVLTDVHEPWQVESVQQVVDVIQIPAFLCRQTDLLVAAGRSGCVVNIKKGQFMHPHDMKYAVDKVKSQGNAKVCVTERGTCFGYRELIVDFRSLVWLRETGGLVVYDATHSLQQPGGAGGMSGGYRSLIEPLARAACAVGVDGFFMEVHDNPQNALSDPATQFPLDQLQPFLETLLDISAVLHKRVT